MMSTERVKRWRHTSECYGMELTFSISVEMLLLNPEKMALFLITQLGLATDSRTNNFLSRQYTLGLIWNTESEVALCQSNHLRPFFFFDTIWTCIVKKWSSGPWMKYEFHQEILPALKQVFLSLLFTFHVVYFKESSSSFCLSWFLAACIFLFSAEHVAGTTAGKVDAGSEAVHVGSAATDIESEVE